MALFTVADVLANIRFDRESKRGSVYDVIQLVTGCESKHTGQTLDRLLERHPDVTGQISTFKFPGQGQRDTPVADIKTLIQIAMTVPGRSSSKWRQHAGEIMIRAFAGDEHLVEEILDIGKDIENDSMLADVSNLTWTPLKEMDFEPIPDNEPTSGVLYVAGSPDVAFLKVGMWTGTRSALLSRYRTVYGRSTYVRTWKSDDVREDEKRVLFALSVFSRGGELIDLSGYDFAVNLLNHNFEAEDDSEDDVLLKETHM